MFMAFKGVNNNLKTSNNSPLKAAFSAFVALPVKLRNAIESRRLNALLPWLGGLSWLLTQNKKKTHPEFAAQLGGFLELQ